MNVEALLDQWRDTRRLTINFNRGDLVYKLTIDGYIAQLEGPILSSGIDGWRISVETPEKTRYGPPDFLSIIFIERLLIALLPAKPLFEEDSLDEHKVYLTIPFVIAPNKEEINKWGWAFGGIENIDPINVKITLASFGDVRKAKHDLDDILQWRYGMKPYIPVLPIAGVKIGGLPAPVNTVGKSGAVKFIERRIRGGVIRAPQLPVVVPVRRRRLPVKEGKAPGIYFNFMRYNSKFLSRRILPCGCFTKDYFLDLPCRCEEQDQLKSFRKCGCFS